MGSNLQLLLQMASSVISGCLLLVEAHRGTPGESASTLAGVIATFGLNSLRKGRR